MTNLEEKIKIAEERISELNILITQWRKQNDEQRKGKEKVIGGKRRRPQDCHEEATEQNEESIGWRAKCCSNKGVCIGFKRVLADWLVLGTTHQTYTYSLLHTFQQYQHVFFKINMYALVDSFCNKCNKYTKIRHFLMQHIHLCILNLIRNRTL